MEDRLIIVDGATFVFSSRNGDIAADRPQGFSSRTCGISRAGA